MSFEVVREREALLYVGLVRPLPTFTSDEQLARARVLGLVNNKLHSSLIFFAT